MSDAFNFETPDELTFDLLGFDAPEPIPAPVGEPTDTVEAAIQEELLSDPVLKIKMDSGLTREFKPADKCYSEAKTVDVAVAELDRINEQLSPLAKQEAEVEAEIRRIKEELNERLRVLAEKRQELREQTYDLKRDKRAAEAALANAMRNLERALEAQRLSEEFKAKSEQFDHLIVNMPWKDKAFPHQIQGAKQLAIAGQAILADKMGLGKSLTSLITADMLMVDRLLIIVPDDVVSNFFNEVKHWTPHRQVIMLGKMPKAQRNLTVELLKTMNEYTVIINYSAWRRDTSLLDKLISLKFQMMIMDEAHTVKNTSTNAYRGCREILMAANACPECNAGIVQKRITGPKTYADGRNMYTGQTDFYHCVNEACGWSQYKDMQNEVERKGVRTLSSINYVYPMTGTVILNKPTDIFALLSLIQPEVYRSEHQFVDQYCYTDYDGKVKFKAGGMDSLAKKLAGRYIARDRNSAGVVLPKQTVLFHNIPMDVEAYPKQAKVIAQLNQHAMIMLESGKQLPILAMIALITRKRQANVWPAGIEIKDEDGVVVFSVGDDVQESIKLDKIITPNGEDGLIPDVTADGDMTNGERVVVFSQFKGPLKELERRLIANGISAVRFDGDTPESLRREIKMDFDRKFCDQPGYEKKWQVVLCNYKTGGVGLNFTSATQMIILDEEWNPGKATQAYGRIDRMGQTEETTVHVLQLERSVDTWMRALNEEKESMINGFEQSANFAAMMLDAMKKGEM